MTHDEDRLTGPRAPLGVPPPSSPWGFFFAGWGLGARVVRIRRPYPRVGATPRGKGVRFLNAKRLRPQPEKSDLCVTLFPTQRSRGSRHE